MAKLTKRLGKVLVGTAVIGGGVWLLHEVRKALYRDNEHAEPVLLVHGFA